MGTHDDVRCAARLTVLAGPSGAGKDSVTELVRARSPQLWLSIPVTTRPRRRYEIDGVHYRFVDRAEFGRLLDAGALLEWSEIGVHRYGTPREPVRIRLSAGRPVLLPIDPGGARQVRAAMPQARLVYLAATPAQARAAGREYDATVVNDVVGRAADELVGLLGSSFLTPT
ncbi:nucleoside/nucleotide kinase family protein [Plantactinospora endophytica]|uniref:Guanylate kinase n=1 Tax=Plantactinospora endophytica TaxID=673535 RepID=A0ABQ4ECL8_9ACTN|nr:guanylate kinase [Plantactinospora endophytica]GIG92457.1 guanylate kinase [Plantactinospora endophytica]